MKFYLEYEQMKAMCLSIADSLRKSFLPDEIVGIARGGLTPAVIIAKELRLPLGVFYTGTTEKESELILTSPYKPEKRIVFVEDIVARGRTFRAVGRHMRTYHTDIAWTFVPIVVDGHIDMPEIFFYGMKTKHWVVMPWEDVDKMKEGDRGLFRERSDAYGK